MSNIKLYTSEDCGQCIGVKRYLAARRHQYEEIDLTHRFEEAIELQQRSGGLIGFPIIEIDGKFIKGLNPHWIESTIQAMSIRA